MHMIQQNCCGFEYFHKPRNKKAYVMVLWKLVNCFVTAYSVRRYDTTATAQGSPAIIVHSSNHHQ